jgi:hypothetical protein
MKSGGGLVYVKIDHIVPRSSRLQRYLYLTSQ